MKPSFVGEAEHPYHLSVGAVVYDQEGQIAVHHFAERFGAKDIYTLMRETIEYQEPLPTAVARGLKEEFDLTGTIEMY